MTCLFFHLWTQWEQYEHDTLGLFTQGIHIGPKITAVEHRQRRHCTRCGYKQDREVGHY